MSFWEFLTDLTLTDWALLFAAWVIIATALGTFAGRAMKHADEPRDWYCTDGVLRTEDDAAVWVAATDGSEAHSLAVPTYLPREWVA